MLRLVLDLVNLDVEYAVTHRALLETDPAI